MTAATCFSLAVAFLADSGGSKFKTCIPPVGGQPFYSEPDAHIEDFAMNDLATPPDLTPDD